MNSSAFELILQRIDLAAITLLICFGLVVYFYYKSYYFFRISKTPGLSSRPSRAKVKDFGKKTVSQGLSKSRNQLLKGFQSLFQSKKSLDPEALEQLHEHLFRSDFGVRTADSFVSYVTENLDSKAAPSWENLRSVLIAKAEKIFNVGEEVSAPKTAEKEVILIVGVNGTGKTTSTGKLAAHFLEKNQSVLLCAADTFRAAAIDQLVTWGKRLNIQTIANKANSDPAAVAFDGISAFKAKNYDKLIIDTAGRLHNRQELMEELTKIKRILNRELPGAPHQVLLVLDATTGQNGFSQVKAFTEAAGVTGLIVSKLDGTAKGGVVVGIRDQFQVPIKYIGIGERTEDLRVFQPKEFIEGLFPTSLT